MLIYSQLAAIAQANPGLLTSYQADLHTHDRVIIDTRAETGARYVWLLDRLHTALFPVATGLDPVWLTGWLEPRMMRADGPAPRCYLIKITGTGPAGANGTVTEITHDEARSLAKEPAPPIRRQGATTARQESAR